MGADKQYFGPHLTATEPWINEIVVFNNGTQIEAFQLTIWNDQGQVTHHESYEISALNSIEFVMASSGVFDQSKIVLDPVNGSFVISTTSEAIAPLLSFQFGESQSISQFFLSDMVADQYLLPNIETEHFSWTGVAVMNPSDQDQKVTFSATHKGATLGYSVKTIAAHSKYVATYDSIWGDLELNDFEQIVISSESSIPAPILISGNSAQDRHVFFSGRPVEKTLEIETEQYNLFSPLNSKITYLMDNDEHIVHTWESDYKPGNSVYLQPDGSIMRTGNVRNSRFSAGGAGGAIQQISWDDQIVWDFTYSSDQYLQHHDIEILPNGNILMIVWELKSQEECIQAGREPSLVSSTGLWVDSVIEVKPTGATSADIAWEWHLWDHLIQSEDSSKDNFGQIAEHPELVNFNYSQNSQEDWTHINSIDYNESLDQIVLSVHNFSEIWIIDHSTTQEEASTHSGGASLKGGDLLFRWGNPQTFDRGLSTDQQLFVQHDAEWIPEGYPGSGNILIFNNGARRPGGNYSSVEEIVPPLKGDGSYALLADLPYGPEQPTWSYSAEDSFSFFATNISGSQRLVNGNTLICDGPAGHFFEVTSDFETVWEYEAGSAVFRVDRYTLNLEELNKK